MPGAGVRQLTWGARARGYGDVAGAARGPRAGGPPETQVTERAVGVAPARSCQACPLRTGLPTPALTASCPSPRHAHQASTSAPGPSRASGEAARGTRLRTQGPRAPHLLRAGAAREGLAGPRV